MAVDPVEIDLAVADLKRAGNNLKKSTNSSIRNAGDNLISAANHLHNAAGVIALPPPPPIPTVPAVLDPIQMAKLVGPKVTLRLVNGDLASTGDGQVIEAVDVRGAIYVRHNNVTVRNFKAYGVQQDNAVGLIVEDGRIEPVSGWNGTDNGIAWANFTARRIEIVHHFDAFKAHGNSVIEDCWVHDLDGTAGGGNTGGGYPHTDGVQISSGANVIIRRSRFENSYGNGGIFADPDFGFISNIVIENCYIAGCGNFGIFLIPSANTNAYQYGKPSGITVTGCVLGQPNNTADWAGYAWVNADNVTWTNNYSNEGKLIPFASWSAGPNKNMKVGP